VSKTYRSKVQRTAGAEIAVMDVSLNGLPRAKGNEEIQSICAGADSP